MNEILLHSSVLAGLRYDLDNQQLWLRFKTEELFVYRMVPSAVVQSLIQARPTGSTSIRLFVGISNSSSYLSAYGRPPCRPGFCPAPHTSKQPSIR